MALEPGDALKDIAPDIDQEPEDVEEAVGPEARTLALALMDAQRAIAGSLDLRTTLRVIAREALTLTRSKAVFVSLLQHGELPVVEVWTDEGELKMSRPWQLSTKNSLATRAIAKRRMVQWARSYRGPANMDPEVRFPVSRRNLSVPLLLDDESLGALTLSHDHDEPFDSRDTLLLEVLAAAAAVAIQNARAHESSLSAAQCLAQERMAQDLHDSVAQSICAIRTRTEDLLQHSELTPPVRRAMEEIGAIAAGADRDLRMAIFSTPYRQLSSHEQLAESLEREVEVHLKHGGVPVTLALDDHVPPMSDEVCEAILLLVRESLTNVRRHSGASGAVVGLSFDCGCARVFVQDNGAGMTADALAAEQTGLHFGLPNLRRLVAQLQGEFLVYNNEDDSGLMVNARFPLVKDGLS